MLHRLRSLPQVPTSPLRHGFRILLGLVLVFAGVSHLTFARAEFLAQVPDWVPLDHDLVVVLSGIIELTLGAALLFLATHRTLVGLATAAFFVAIFPGNIGQYVEGVDGFGLNTDQARLTRLFFQPVLVAWALWSTGAWRALRGGAEISRARAGEGARRPRTARGTGTARGRVRGPRGG